MHLRHDRLDLLLRSQFVDTLPRLDHRRGDKGRLRRIEFRHVIESLRRKTKALLRLMRDHWSIEGWHWIRDTQLHEDADRFRGNGAGVMATLRTDALNLLRLTGFRSIRAGIQAVMHDITALLAMVQRYL